MSDNPYFNALKTALYAAILSVVLHIVDPREAVYDCADARIPYAAANKAQDVFKPREKVDYLRKPAVATTNPVFTDNKPDAKAELYKTIIAKVTGYDACEDCCGKSDGITSIGDDANKIDGVAGANPKKFKNALPYRTVLDIEGVGIREIDDCGGAMNSSLENGEYHFDVRFATHEQAKLFGVRYAKVKIISVPETKPKNTKYSPQKMPQQR